MHARVSQVNASPRPGAIALCLAMTTATFAQQAPTEITIIAEPLIRVSGFDDTSQHELPISVTSFDNATLRDVGAQRITDALRLDASVSDSYNLPAYWDKLSVRGYALDNRYNYRLNMVSISCIRARQEHFVQPLFFISEKHGKNAL